MGAKKPDSTSREIPKDYCQKTGISRLTITFSQKLPFYWQGAAISGDQDMSSRAIDIDSAKGD